MSVKNSQKQSTEDIGETRERVFPFQVQVRGAGDRSPARRIPAAQYGDTEGVTGGELSAIGWSLDPRMFPGGQDLSDSGPGWQWTGTRGRVSVSAYGGRLANWCNFN